MRDDRIRRLRDLFDQAVQLPAEERERFVEDATTDTDLRNDLLALLAHDDPSFDPIIDLAGGGEETSSDSSPPALTAGLRLGPYEVVGAVGAGGMGEVYRARDTRLDRTVAIKVLPPQFAASPERRRRLEREARAISRLSHPNICALYDIGREDGIDFLVMEYLDGETLAQRLERGGVGLDEALDIAIQISGALDAAHRQGVVHRDLKPANVVLTRSGAKLLDFGIARFGGAPNEFFAASAAASTRTRGLTGERTILGTLQYMAPEQLEGRPADTRSDIWALGVVLHEMLSGRRTFEADSEASLVAAILERDPEPLATLVPSLPPALDRLVHKCLAKDPEDRWQSARDLVYELGWIGDAGLAAGAAEGRSPSSAGERYVWTALALALLISLIVVWFRPQRTVTTPRPARFPVTLPEGVELISSRVSPDGRHLSFTVVTGTGTQIWIRALDGLAAQPLDGTEGARWWHFWSPDSRFIAFFADGELRRIDVGGGPPQVVSDAPGTGPVQSGTWNQDGTILFDVLEMPGADGLYRVPATGGEATRVTIVDAEGSELHPLFPSFLPDGRHFLFVAVGVGETFLLDPAGVYVASLDAKRAVKVMDTSSHVEYVDPGYLLYAQEGALLAHAFDAAAFRLEGDPHHMVEGVEMFSGIGAPNFSASRNGVLAYTGRGERTSRLLWRDREGRTVGEVGKPAVYGQLRLSPDERELAVSIVEPRTSMSDLWIFELQRDVPTRFTTDARSVISPTWSPDGQRVVFSMPRAAPPFMHMKSRDGGEPTALLPSSGTNQWPWDWSADGRLLLFGDRSPETNWDIWVLPMDDGEARPVLRTRFREFDARLSPDGRWMAFCSDESGEHEVYVQPFPGSGGKLRISKGGGFRPEWRGDGAELFYVSNDMELMAVPMATTERPEPGAATPLFRDEQLLEYDVAADGQRFLVNTVDAGAAPSTVVLLDWTAALRR